MNDYANGECLKHEQMIIDDLAYELHKPARLRPDHSLQVITDGIDSFWKADLADLQTFHAHACVQPIVPLCSSVSHEPGKAICMRVLDQTPGKGGQSLDWSRTEHFIPLSTSRLSTKSASLSALPVRN